MPFFLDLSTLTIIFVMSLTASPHPLHTGRHALRNELGQEFTEDHNREERHRQSEAGFTTAESAATPMAHS
jgi:hypothetical protein